MMPTATRALQAAGGLTLMKKCGEKFCAEYHLCLDHDSQCYPCRSYCEVTSNNFDASICEHQCQDYIHDFVRHYVKHDDIKNALEKLENMQMWMAIIVVMVFTALILASVTLAFIWSRERRVRKIKNGGQDSFFKQKLASLQYVKKKDQVKTVSETVFDRTSAAANRGTSLAATQTDTHASTTVSSASSTAPRTNTSSAGGISSADSSSSSSNKLPCEDATLEFSGYDNFALKVSPVLGGKTASSAIACTDLLQQYTP